MQKELQASKEEDRRRRPILNYWRRLLNTDVSNLSNSSLPLFRQSRGFQSPFSCPWSAETLNSYSRTVTENLTREYEEAAGRDSLSLPCASVR